MLRLCRWMRSSGVFFVPFKIDLPERKTRGMDSQTDSSSKIVEFPEPTSKSGSASQPFTRGIGSADMRSDLVEEASQIIPEPPMLINLVSARVKQLNMGRPPLIKPDHRMGAADIALTEIIEGKITPEGDENE